jgi:hypothetical protein
MGPAWLVLGAGLTASLVSPALAAYIGTPDSWWVIWRFLRLCLVVSLPLLSLPWLCSLLGVADLPVAGQHLSRLLLSVWGAGVVSSLLLAALWTLDDLNLRLYNAGTGEVQRIGRYLGVILPIPFGSYGIYNVFADNAHLLALRMTIRMMVLLYPVFVVLSVLHSHLLRAWREPLRRRLGPRPGRLVLRAEAAGPDQAEQVQNSLALDAFSPPSTRQACDEPSSS